jgi:Flp pilus assembly protein TadG
MKSSKKSLIRDESGAVAVLISFLMILLLGCAALAVDLGHLYSVRQELRNAAEAGALAGSRALVPFINLAAPVPYWSNGEAVARQTVQGNKGDGALLTDCQVEMGFYNLSTKVLQSTAINPTNLDVAAVRVTVRKTAGQNGGPVPLAFAKVLGFNLADVSGQAMAMISGPSSIPAHGGMFPIAVAEALVQAHWDDNPAYRFKIGSDYHYDAEQAGQWTTFLVDENNVPYVRELMANGNPDRVNVGDHIWIEPGTKDTLFANAADYIGKTVILPVVHTDFDTHAWTPVLAFVPFYIEEATGGSGKYIAGHFVRDYIDNDARPGGVMYGDFAPPKLVQ